MIETQSKKELRISSSNAKWCVADEYKWMKQLTRQIQPP